jgi:hypothetical protein
LFGLDVFGSFNLKGRGFWFKEAICHRNNNKASPCLCFGKKLRDGPGEM